MAFDVLCSLVVNGAHLECAFGCLAGSANQARTETVLGWVVVADNAKQFLHRQTTLDERLDLVALALSRIFAIVSENPGSLQGQIHPPQAVQRADAFRSQRIGMLIARHEANTPCISSTLVTIFLGKGRSLLCHKLLVDGQ